MVTAIPVANFSAQKIVLYDYLEGIRRGGNTSQKSRDNLLSNETNGHISHSAQKRIITAVNWLYALSPVQRHYLPESGRYVAFRISLITLTLPSPQSHADNEIKSKCLNAFLQKLRKTHGLKSYIWKAEPQKNGNIHFHITTNLWLHFNTVRAIWNECLELLGYITAYTARTGKTNPPTTEIKSVKKVKKLASYVAKYLTKESEVRPIQGRQWYLSTNLSALKPIQIVQDTSLLHELECLVSDQKAFWKAGEYATVIFADIFGAKLPPDSQLFFIRQKILSDYSPLIACNN